MNDVATSLDFELLARDMPKQSCEHSLHAKQTFCHADGDETYVHRHCPAGCYEGVRVYCGAYVNEMRRTANDWGICRRCGNRSTLGATFTILGPVNGGAK